MALSKKKKYKIVLFRGWKFFLVGWSQLQCFSPVPMGKNFSAISACDFFFAYFFGHSIWLRAMEHCTSVPWLCECWCGHTWECFKSPWCPLWGCSLWNVGDIPCRRKDAIHLVKHTHPEWCCGGIRELKTLPSVTAPAFRKPWYVAEEICAKNAGWNIFYSRDLIEAWQLRPIKQKKTNQTLKNYFWSIIHSKSKLRHHVVGSELVNLSH